MFHAYLMNAEKVMPIDFKDIIDDHYILNQFLEGLEDMDNPPTD